MEPNREFMRRKARKHNRYRIVALVCTYCGHRKVVPHDVWTDPLEEIVCTLCGRTEAWDIAHRNRNRGPS